MAKFNVPNDNYFCVINGNKVTKIDCNKKPILRECNKQAKKGKYTELWYCYSSGKQNLIDYWN